MLETWLQLGGKDSRDVCEEEHSAHQCESTKGLLISICGFASSVRASPAGAMANPSWLPETSAEWKLLSPLCCWMDGCWCELWLCSIPPSRKKAPSACQRSHVRRRKFSAQPALQGEARFQQRAGRHQDHSAVNRQAARQKKMEDRRQSWPGSMRGLRKRRRPRRRRNAKASWPWSAGVGAKTLSGSGLLEQARRPRCIAL